MELSKLIRTLVAAPLLLACAGALANPTYTVTVVGPAGSYATGMNDRGQVVGNSFNGGAFLFSDLSFESINAGPSTAAAAVNNLGQVIGTAQTAGGKIGYAYLNGDLRTFGDPAGNTVPMAINDAGQIVGYQNLNGPTSIYVDANGVPMAPINFGGNIAVATAINNRGDVAAAVNLAGAQHAFMSVGGVVTDLGTLGGNWSAPSDINDLGQVVGSSSMTLGPNLHAFLYAGGTMTDLGTLGEQRSSALAINNLGQVVGSSFSADWNDGHGFLYSDGHMVDLNTMIDPAGGWTIAEASDINSAGQIAGFAYKNGVGYAVRLDLVSAVPEPGSVAMLVGGLGLLAMRARRRAVARRERA
jgi:probable HAF family extracellular repeat protein